MQLTSFDRWLRKRFLYETHIKTLRPAEEVPKRIKVVNLEETPMSRFRHLYIGRNSKDIDELIKHLSDNTQTFTTDIVERKSWYLPIITPEGKSFTWSLASLLMTIIISVTVIFWVRNTLQNPKVRDGIQQALDLIDE